MKNRSTSAGNGRIRAENKERGHGMASKAVPEDQTPSDPAINALGILSGLGSRALSILSAVAKSPASARDLTLSAPRSSVHASLSRLSARGLVRKRNGLYHPTPLAKELASSTRPPKPHSKDDEGSATSYQKLAEQRIEQEKIRTQTQQAKLETLQARTPDDIDEALKTERVRSLRLRNDRVEIANREREIKLRVLEAESAEQDPASERAKTVKILRREPNIGRPWAEWRTTTPEQAGGDPTNAIQVIDGVEALLSEEGNAQCEHRVRLLNARGRIIEDVEFPARESPEERGMRKWSEKLHAEELKLAQRKARRLNRKRLMCVLPPWRLPYL